MTVIFVSQNEFDTSLKESCDYRSFTQEGESYQRFNEFENDDVYRISEDSLFFKKKGGYLIDGMDETGVLCADYCNVKYFSQNMVESYYLIKAFIREGEVSAFSLLLTDSLTAYKPLSLLPFQTIYDNPRKLLFSTEYFKRFPNTNEITFYKWVEHEIKPILRLRLYNKMLESPFFYHDELFFIYIKDSDSYYAKMKIPSEEEFNSIKEIPPEMILDSISSGPPPPSPKR